MKNSLLKDLECPFCHQELGLIERQFRNEEIESGKLLCSNCARVYPIVDCVARFVLNDAYVSSFSFEWKMFPRVLYGADAEETFARFNINLNELSGERILDVGCGSGRFVDFFSRFGSKVVGVDLSNSVDQAFRLCGHKFNVDILQADISALPLKGERFDLVFSFGVLHHTPVTKKAFMQLPKLVAPGGKLAIFVYAHWFETGTYWVNRATERLGESWSVITSRMPRPLLYAISHAAIPSYSLKRWRVVGRFAQAALPSSEHPDWRVRVLDTFDRYSPRYQWKHTTKEVSEWFEEAGFGDIVTSSTHPVTIVGTKH